MKIEIDLDRFNPLRLFRRKPVVEEVVEGREENGRRITGEEQWARWREKEKVRATQHADKEMYFLVGSILAKVKIHATKRENFGWYVSFFCAVMEIDGVAVSQEEQDAKKEVFRSDEEYPSVEEQQQVLTRALEKFGLRGRIAQVSDDYVEGHLRALALQQRGANARRGPAYP